MKNIYCLLISCLFSVTSFSQQQAVEISHYILPEFTPGLILLKSGIELKPLLNYNALTEEMIFEEKGQRLAISKQDLNQIDSVFIGGRKFILYSDRFIEWVHSGKFDLYVEHKCTINMPGKPAGYGSTSQTAAIDSYSSIRMNGMVYNLSLPEDYKVKPYFNYWLRKNGKLEIFVNMKQLGALYKDKKDLFKAYIKEHDVKYNNREGIIQLIEYLETN